jgi:ATP-dependent exoDNAse (exonuclease V) beta subunit
MAEGIVDLAFQDQLAAGGWVIVDYKTDFELKGRMDDYRNQVWLYAQAVSHATASKTQPVLLRI